MSISAPSCAEAALGGLRWTAWAQADATDSYFINYSSVRHSTGNCDAAHHCHPPSVNMTTVQPLRVDARWTGWSLVHLFHDGRLAMRLECNASAAFPIAQVPANIAKCTAASDCNLMYAPPLHNSAFADMQQARLQQGRDMQPCSVAHTIQGFTLEPAGLEVIVAHNPSVCRQRPVKARHMSPTARHLSCSRSTSGGGPCLMQPTG
jgi:hypothetical protein